MRPFAFTLPLVHSPADPLGYSARLPLPAAAVAELPVRDDGSRRFRCAVANLPPWPAALLPDGSGDFFVIVNKRRRAALEASGLDLTRLPVVLTPDDSPYGMPMPPELGELLAQDPRGSDYFHQLTPGRQRALIHRVASAKREDTRSRRAVGIVEYLVDVRGRLDMRELQSALRGR